MKTLVTLAEEYKQLLDDMIRKAEIISKLPPNELKQRKLAWTGIVGAIQDSIDTNRCVKILNTVVCEGENYGNMFYYLAQTAKDFVEIQKQVQEQTTPDDAAFYGNINKYEQAALALHHVLCAYSPTVATEVNAEDNMSFALWSISSVRTALKQLQLPPEKEEKASSPSSSNNEGSGCFGAMMLMVVSTIALAAGVGFGLTKLIG